LKYKALYKNLKIEVMKTETTSKTNVTQRLSIVLGIVVLILLIPLVAMQFTNEVNWDLTDFIVMGALLFLTGTCIEVVTRVVKSAQLKLAFTLIILLILFLVWAELAVGIFGSPFAGS
jgi:DMSO/TMAO reductase YedYZ heme-binding membrane subunit